MAANTKKQVRFLILGLNYLPESTSIGPYTADLAEHLAACGHRVQVITGFPMAPQWRVWDGYRGRWSMREAINGIPLLRTFLYVPAKPNKAIKRILFDVSFSLSALVGGLCVGRPDLIIVVSPPLQLGLTGWVLGLLTRVPFFLHIQDLVPDAAVATSIMSEGSPAIRLARAMERFVYARAASIGVISEGYQRNLIGKGVPREKIKVLPNYIDLEFLKSGERNNGFRQSHGISPDQFLVMYSGSVALKQGLQTFVEAAYELRKEDQSLFYLMGEGPYLTDLQRMARERALTNVHFFPLQPRESLPQQLGAADVLVVTQRRSVTDMVFPGKLLYYMAASRPIVAAVSSESETGRFIKESGVGVVVPPEQPHYLSEAIRYLRDHPEEASRLGRNGRKTVEQRFDRSILLRAFTDHVEHLAAAADRQ